MSLDQDRLIEREQRRKLCKFDFHGSGHPFGTAYKSERGAKGRATKTNGNVIIKEGLSYFWSLPLDVPLTSKQKVVSIRKGGKWIPTEHSAEHKFQWIKENHLTYATGGGFESNIIASKDVIYKLYNETDGDLSGRVHPQHEWLTEYLNKETSAAVIQSGRNDEVSFFFIEHKGKPEKDFSTGNWKKRQRDINKIIKIISVDSPFIIESMSYDVSGEGDYATTLKVWT